MGIRMVREKGFSQFIDLDPGKIPPAALLPQRHPQQKIGAQHLLCFSFGNFSSRSRRASGRRAIISPYSCSVSDRSILASHTWIGIFPLHIRLFFHFSLFYSRIFPM